MGEAINAATFASFATAVEAAVSGVDVLRTLSLNRDSALVAASVGTNVAVGVATTITYDTEQWDVGGLANLGVSNDRLTIQRNGVYMFRFGSNSEVAATTMTSCAVIITKNAVAFAERKQDITAGTSTHGVQASAMSSCVAGDIIRVQYLWTGTGGPLAITARLGARLVTLP